SRDHDVIVSEGRVTGGPRLPIIGGASGAEASSVAPPACVRAWREAPSDSQRSSGDGAASELNERARAGSGVRAGADRRVAPRASAPDDLWESEDRKSTRLNSSHVAISYAVFCWKKKDTVEP